MISWLPAAHIAERMAHHYLPIVFAMTITTLPEPARGRRLPAGRQADVVLRGAADLGEAEGGHGGAFSSRARTPTRNRAWLEGAAAQGRARAGGGGGARRISLRTVEEADRELFAGLRAMLGLDEAVSVNVGAAPTPREVLVFFHAIGIPLAELWGMSETCGAGCLQPARPGQDRHGRPARRRASSCSWPTTASC